MAVDTSNIFGSTKSGLSDCFRISASGTERIPYMGISSSPSNTVVAGATMTFDNGMG